MAHVAVTIWSFEPPARQSSNPPPAGATPQIPLAENPIVLAKTQVEADSSTAAGASTGAHGGYAARPPARV